MRGRSNFLLMVLLCLTSLASAANVGVSPAVVNFYDVLRGGYAERPIIITIDTESPTEVAIEKRGEIESWLSFSENNFSVSKDSPYQLMVSVTPPADMPNGNYTGFVTIKSNELSSGQEGHATGLVVPILDVFVRVEITDQEIVSCRASQFKVASVEEGEDIVFELDILNNGNVRINPTVTFDIWDQDSVNLLKQEDYSQIQIIPTQKNHFLIKIPSTGLDLGQYWVEASALDCYASQMLTFDVLEEGALKSEGILEKITMVPWAEVGDIVPLFVSFRNTGEKPLEARFVGQVMFKDKIIQLLESDESLYVPMEDQSNFQFYFTPKKAGRYVISGRVFYDNKRTYEQSAILNVNSPSALESIIKNVTYTVLILIIAILLFKIRKERRGYFNKIKRSHL